MKKILSISILVTTFPLLTSCASIVNGTNQSVAVNTTPTKNAMCTLTNDKGKWYVNQTPGSVTVHRSYKDLIVDCKKGNKEAKETIPSKTKGMVFGNAIFGGVIGAGIDVADGSAYDYPENIQVPMRAS